MARTLIWMLGVSRSDPHGFIDIPKTAPKYVLRSNEVGKLAWWNLVERHPDKQHGGLWRMTQLGADFAMGSTALPARVVLYNNQCEGFEGDQITVSEALGSKFDYEELMRVR